MKDDTISRQAAIEALKKISFSHWFECGEYLSEDTREIEIINSNKAFEAIEALPSAQPEQRWIPCSERLPEEMGTYMTTIDYGEHRLVTGQRYYYGRGLKWNDECVIAWMPLPEPYNAESEDKE